MAKKIANKSVESDFPITHFKLVFFSSIQLNGPFTLILKEEKNRMHATRKTHTHTHIGSYKTNGLYNVQHLVSVLFVAESQNYTMAKSTKDHCVVESDIMSAASRYSRFLASMIAEQFLFAKKKLKKN